MCELITGQALNLISCGGRHWSCVEPKRVYPKTNIGDVRIQSFRIASDGLHLMPHGIEPALLLDQAVCPFRFLWRQHLRLQFANVETCFVAWTYRMKQEANDLSAESSLRLIDTLQKGVAPAIDHPLTSVEPFLMSEAVFGNVSVFVASTRGTSPFKVIPGDAGEKSRPGLGDLRLETMPRILT